MSIIRNLPKHENDKESLGLTAIGAAGSWEIAVDETTSGTTQKWFAQIEGPSVYLYFAVQSPRVKTNSEAGGYRRTGQKAGRRNHLLPRKSSAADPMMAPLAAD